MSTHKVTFSTTIHLTVTVDARGEDAAGDAAWELAEEYLRTVGGNYRDVVATATLDGIGPDEVTSIDERGNPIQTETTQED